MGLGRRDAVGECHQTRGHQGGAGEVGATDPHDGAVALVALAEGLAYYVLIGAYPVDSARERLLTAIADLYDPSE